MRSSRGYRSVLAALLLTCALTVSLCAQSDPADSASKPYWMTVDNERLGRIDQTAARLLRPVTFDFQGSPLDDAMRELGKQADIAFTFNMMELDNAGLTVDQPVNASNRAVTLREALQQILTPFDLTIRLHESDIEVTTTDEAEDAPVARVYDLAQLSKSPLNIYELSVKISQIVEPDQWRDFGGTGNSVMLGFGSAMVVAAPDSTHTEVRRLLNTIARAPASPQTQALQDSQWQSCKSFGIASGPAGNNQGQSGSLTLPAGGQYELVRIIQQPVAPAETAGQNTWTSPAEAPAWSKSEEGLLDDSSATRAKLRQTLSIKVQGQPLSVVLANLFKQLELSYWINAGELDSLGLTVDQPITMHLPPTTAYCLISRLLQPLDLAIRVRGSSIEVTSMDDVSSNPVTRAFDLSALCDQPFDMQALMLVISQTVTPDEWTYYGGTGNATMVTFGPRLVVSAPETSFFEIDSLLTQLAKLPVENFPRVDPRTRIRIETVMTGIPGGSTIQVPTDGFYQIQPVMRNH